jgi:hypothetical protein
MLQPIGPQRCIKILHGQFPYQGSGQKPMHGPRGEVNIGVFNDNGLSLSGTSNLQLKRSAYSKFPLDHRDLYGNRLKLQTTVSRLDQIPLQKSRLKQI